MSLLSFIVPVYRKEAIIEKCVKSLVAQSLKSWEAVFVLDGEDSVCESIIHRAMKGCHNAYKVVTIEHGGACKARNEGFKNSRGEYVVFLDADIVIEPDAAKTWVDILDRDDTVDFVYSSYKFLNEQGAINSEPFDEWLLKVRNYISGCFPVRRSLVPHWNESLKSLQDWDFWLQVVAKGGKGKFMQGYAWSTAYPDKESISGTGCTADVWLERVDAVKATHGLPDRDICVAAPGYKSDGVALAKQIDADYQDFPTWKPHKYKKIIQIGFSMHPSRVESHASIFNDANTERFLFWTGDNIAEVYNAVNYVAIKKYRTLLNSICKAQFVEDKSAKDMMQELGFNVQVLPLPFKSPAELKPLPEKPRFAVDICGEYGQVFNMLDGSLPDVELELLTGDRRLEEYTGLIHFFLDRTMSNSIKRMILGGRYVISNVQAPFAGYVKDDNTPDEFIPDMVSKVREVVRKSKQGHNKAGMDYYLNAVSPDRVLEAIK